MPAFQRISCLVATVVLILMLGATGPQAAGFQSCIESLKAQAINAGVAPRIAQAALSNVAYDEKVIRFSRSQPEYKTPIWDYMAFLVDEKRISDGRKMLRKHGRTLKAVERAYGVDRHVVLAVWGVESDYGQETGDFFVPHSLANLACAGRRAKYFRSELFEALKIASRGDVALKDLNGSWAGAFGQTQFMPSTYRRLAVDFDGDKHADLVRSEADALASTANYLRSAGWRKGEAWGFEVRVPKGYQGPSGRKRTASLSSWGKRGVTALNGKRVGGGTKAALLLPAGRNGPAFLVFRNFNAIYSYNVAVSYALAISHLSDRLKGGGEFQTPWPTNDPGLSRAQRLQLQKLLLRAGYDIGEPDGKVGPATRAGIKQAEARFGMPQTGRPGTKIYRALGGR
ncbi:lytic murein transglycosylase [Rhizobiales bacterium]|uniref:lytic murein transglycosylase n=1 Tax=Hongsoonwoonella zoysiae TaxID=2821844 RepID=UPI001561936E|nr:lytic murein transglycosylase [Hongsoonwoonella zoysiae]NRG18140.1 lytic murein transglycosylase [Hongsoonwoonella zoysiae]